MGISNNVKEFSINTLRTPVGSPVDSVRGMYYGRSRLANTDAKSFLAGIDYLVNILTERSLVISALCYLKIEYYSPLNVYA